MSVRIVEDKRLLTVDSHKDCCGMDCLWGGREYFVPACVVDVGDYEPSALYFCNQKGFEHVPYLLASRVFVRCNGPTAFGGYFIHWVASQSVILRQQMELCLGQGNGTQRGCYEGHNTIGKYVEHAMKTTHTPDVDLRRSATMLSRSRAGRLSGEGEVDWTMLGWQSCRPKT